MQTLIELYDDRPLENVLSSQVFRPECTVFICPDRVKNNRKAQNDIKKYLSAKGCSTDIRFETADMFSAADVLRVLEKVISRCPDCVLDITGGTDAALFAAGVLSARRDTPAFTYSRRENCFFSINNAPFGAEKHNDLVLRVEDCFLMAGGSVRKGRVDNAVLKNYLGFFKPFFNLYLRFRTDWTSIITYMQRVSAPVDGVILLDVDAPRTVKAPHGGTLHIKNDALKALADIGFLKNMDLSAPDRVRFRFRDSQVLFWLRDIGSVLETYVYKVCLDTGLFDDVCTSVIVDWEGDNKQDNVTNELDVMTTRGIMPVFISCKTCEIKTEALNELQVLRDRFGGKIAKAAIVSSSKCQSITRHRAAELGIEVVDLSDLRAGRLETRLRALAEKIR